MFNFSLTALMAAAGVACGPTDAQVIALGTNADTLKVRGQNDSIVLLNPDTMLGPADTVIITRVDTIIAVPDSVVVVDTIIEGSDTTFVIDTLATVDTIVLTSVDTVVTADTVIVGDTIRVETELVAASNSQSLDNGLVIDSGQTSKLTVTTENLLDQPSVPSSVTWLSDAPGTASVTNEGIVAGKRPGNANIFAIAEGLAATVPTTVRRVESTSPPEPLPEGSQSQYFRAHEPAGMTKISERPFSQLDEGWHFEFDGSPEEITVDSDAPHSPPDVIQFNYREGFQGGGPGGNRGQVLFPRPFDIVYVYLTWKIDPNWQGHQSTVNKQFYLHTTNPEVGSGYQTIFNARTRDAGPINFRLSGQAYCCDDPYPVFDGNVGDDTLRRGQWHEIEMVATANTPGVADGRIEIWIDGAKSHDHRDFNVLTAAEGPGFDQLFWTSIWGGIGDTVENAMWIRVDHIYISGKN